MTPRAEALGLQKKNKMNNYLQAEVIYPSAYLEQIVNSTTASLD